MNYDKELPNFLCTETVRRFDESNDPTVSAPAWQLVDTIGIQLTYFERHEAYKVMTMNGEAMPETSLERLGGNWTSGEFGTLLKGIFRAESHASFEWVGGMKIRGRKASVLSYDVMHANSKYELVDEKSNTKCFAAFRGQIFVDETTATVLRIVMSSHDLPPKFAIKSVTTTLDYGPVNIAGKQYMLPVRADIISNHHSLWTRNLKEFRDYRKFGVGTKLTFDETGDSPQ